MFKSVEPLTKENHQNLRFTSIQNYNFAAKTSNAPIGFSEFAQCAKYYPIVFSKGTPMPMVVLSLKNDENNFINQDGTWKVPYVPAHFRRYPFVLAKVGDQAPENADSKESAAKQEQDVSAQEKYVVCIDRVAPHFATEQGDLMFTANGDFTELTTRGVNFLQQYQREMALTMGIVELLIEKDVLVDRQFKINVDGQQRAVGGFKAVDMEKVNALDDSILADWVRRGIIFFICTHLNSLQGIQMQ